MYMGKTGCSFLIGVFILYLFKQRFKFSELFNEVSVNIITKILDSTVNIY